MSSFTSPLNVTPLPDGKNWSLNTAFIYHVGSKSSRTTIRVPAGFEMDFASLPRITNPLLIAVAFILLFLAYYNSITWAFYLGLVILLLVCLSYMMPLWTKYTKGSVLHDYLYETKKIMGKTITRKEADKIFLEAMLVEWRDHKSRHILGRVMYCMVRLFAGFAWK